jgi:hypothetical protein
MARLRSICIIAVLGSAISPRPATSQAASVSLTHTVSVTVPARIKVEVANSAVAAHETRMVTSNGLALSVNATQAWSLSIDAPKHSKVRWSRDGTNTFFALKDGRPGIASGTRSSITTATTIFVRPGTEDSRGSSEAEHGIPATVLLTIVAQ